ncbi:outer membrane protein [Methylocapsa aurea]|uniref:outer membrane protein n=1 Tax=Methylocapsa aurea TaxID=663610 RepID=UPI00055E7177|nr:outer membrane protein [Methylocapsa aurea]
MLRKVLLASAGAVALAGSAVAADLPSRAPPPPYLPPAPIFTWTGLYIGGQVGYGWGRDSATLFDPGTPDIIIPDQGVIPGIPATSFPINFNPGGVIGGAHLGYNLQIGQWVAGLEGDVNGTSISQNFGAGFLTGSTFTTRANVQGSIRLRAGIAFDRVLLFATGGAAFTGLETSYSTFLGYDNLSRTRAGWTVGGGIEYAITNNWSIQAEYRYSDFGRYTDYLINSFPAPSLLFPGANVKHHYTQNQVQIGFSYKFDSFAPAPVVAKY